MTKEPPHRYKRLNVRIDEETYETLQEKASVHGGISAVIRAMIRTFIRGKRNFALEDLAEEHKRAPKKTGAKSD